MDKSLKLYVHVRKIFSKDISLGSVIYHSQNTLNLAIETNNKVAEMNMSLEKIPIPDMIHPHK